MYLCDDPAEPRNISADERLEEVASILRIAFMDTSVAFGGTTATTSRLRRVG